MALRSFLFLDTATLNDYLGTLEGSILDGGIDQTDVEKKDKGGKLGYAGFGVGATAEHGLEEKQRRVIPDAARFQKLYELVKEQQDFSFLDAFDDEIWNQVHRGDVVEALVTITLPESLMLTQAVEQISPLLDIMKAFGQDPLAESKSKFAFEGMREVAKLSEERHLPLMAESVSTSGYTYAAELPKRYLRGEIKDLQGEATVFGTVQRIIPKGETHELFNLIPGLTSLPNTNRQQRRKMQREMAKKSLAEIVKGPAIILTPVAVYR